LALLAEAVALTSYGTALANHNEPEKAFVLFERSLVVEPNDRVTLFIYGTQLGQVGEYNKAIEMIEKMTLTGLPKSQLDLSDIRATLLFDWTGKKRR
jgi:tetratricopeptide (TPR) repeat protein